jgi:hypothetical protein
MLTFANVASRLKECTGRDDLEERAAIRIQIKQSLCPASAQSFQPGKLKRQKQKFMYHHQQILWAMIMENLYKLFFLRT